MTMWRNIFRKSLVTVFILVSLTTSAWGQRPGLGPIPFGSGFQGFTEFTGQIVCVGCSLEEVRKTRPRLHNLYQLNHEQEQIVIQIDSFADPSERHYWQTVVGLTDKVSVRAATDVLKELTTEENLFKEMIVTGILRSTRTLDIGSVRVKG
jgi:hypothetical protein